MNSWDFGEAMLESAGAGIYALDRNGLCTFMNKAAAKLLGYAKEECVGRDMHQLTHSRRADGSAYPVDECPIVRVARTGVGLHVDDEVLWRKDGTFVPVEYFAEPLVVGGTITGIIVTANDVTERKKASAALQESEHRFRTLVRDLESAKQAAEEANLAKSQFLASMSHELRTPLNAIIGYSEMLQEEAEDLGASALNSDLQKIYNAGRHLLSLINDILDLTKIEAGKVEVFPESFDLRAVLEDVCDTIEPLVIQNSNLLGRNFEDELGVMHSDLTKIRQTLFNLLSNAAKFTSNGDITVHVGKQGPDWVYIDVRDSGIGMTPEQVGRLFEPFSQADRSTSRLYGGTGLGLAISRHFVEMLGGQIEVNSALGQGSTFTVRLPRNAAKLELVESVPVFKATGGAVSPGMRKPLALIIDDDASARELMKRYLSREGFDAVLAGSGEEGLAAARKLKPDVITLDVMMPGMDGWSVLQRIKDIPDLRDTPVIMATMIEDKKLGYVLGVSDYLVKPIDREQLSKTLRRLDCAPPCRVLVVDDDEGSRGLIRAILEREGWIVIEGSDGLDGLMKMADEKPDLVLLDLMMPKMNGFAFTMEVRRRSQFAAIPIVVLTAKDLTAEEREQLNGSVTRVISKSAYRPDELLTELRQLVRLRAGVARLTPAS